MKNNKPFLISAFLNLILFVVAFILVVRFDVIDIAINKFTGSASVPTIEVEAYTTDTIVLSDDYRGRTSLYNELTIENDDIVMLGDSITQYGEWQELFENTNVLNRGIGGDTVAGVLNRLNNIVENKPNKILLNVGINDIYKGFTTDNIVKDYESLITVIKNESSRTDLVLFSVLPVNNTEYNHPVDNQDVVELNKEIEKLAKDYDLKYIDAFSQLINSDNELHPEFTYDGVHLSGEGYKLYADIAIDNIKR